MDTPTRVRLMEEAAEITLGDRNQSYGDPVDNFHRISQIMLAIVSGVQVTPPEMAVMAHIATKLARMSTSPMNRDHYVDLIAYVGILYEIRLDMADKNSQELDDEETVAS